jgi:hypothetical protein
MFPFSTIHLIFGIGVTLSKYETLQHYSTIGPLYVELV